MYGLSCVILLCTIVHMKQTYKRAFKQRRRLTVLIPWKPVLFLINYLGYFGLSTALWLDFIRMSAQYIVNIM